jgi:hypothetical protein
VLSARQGTAFWAFCAVLQQHASVNPMPGYFPNLPVNGERKAEGVKKAVGLAGEVWAAAAVM